MEFARAAQALAPRVAQFTIICIIGNIFYNHETRTPQHATRRPELET